MTIDQKALELGWKLSFDGSYKRPGSTFVSSGLCTQDGLSVSHSHYHWSKDAFWAVFSEEKPNV